MHCLVYKLIGGSPGLVVMGRESQSDGCGFESQHYLLEGHFFTLICYKNCPVCWKKIEKLKRKRPRLAHLKDKLIDSFCILSNKFDFKVTRSPP